MRTSLEVHIKLSAHFLSPASIIFPSDSSSLQHAASAFNFLFVLEGSFAQALFFSLVKVVIPRAAAASLVLASSCLFKHGNI
jgi:hexokinase